MKIKNYDCILGEYCSKTGHPSAVQTNISPGLLPATSSSSTLTVLIQHGSSFWHLTGEDAQFLTFSLLSRGKGKQCTYSNSVAISRGMEVYRVWRFVSEMLYYYVSIINIMNNITILIIIVVIVAVSLQLFINVISIINIVGNPNLIFILLLSIILERQCLR